MSNRSGIGDIYGTGGKITPLEILRNAEDDIHPLRRGTKSAAGAGDGSDEHGHEEHGPLHLEDERLAALPWWQRVLWALGCSWCLSPLITLEDVGLDQEQIELLRMMTPYSEKELYKLAHRFLALDADGSNFVSHAEVAEMAEIAASPWSSRIMYLLGIDAASNKHMSFMDFSARLAVFSERCPKSAKIKFLFQLYDFDEDGFIGKEDLTMALSRTVADAGVADYESLLQDIVERTFQEVDTAHHDQLDLKEFASLIGNTDVQSNVRFKI
jgi:Ca2+-binding EF-hand superfamily protein